MRALPCLVGGVCAVTVLGFAVPRALAGVTVSQILAAAVVIWAVRSLNTLCDGRSARLRCLADEECDGRHAIALLERNDFRHVCRKILRECRLSALLQVQRDEQRRRKILESRLLTSTFPTMRAFTVAAEKWQRSCLAGEEARARAAMRLPSPVLSPRGQGRSSALHPDEGCTSAALGSQWSSPLPSMTSSVAESPRRAPPSPFKRSVGVQAWEHLAAVSRAVQVGHSIVCHGEGETCDNEQRDVAECGAGWGAPAMRAWGGVGAGRHHDEVPGGRPVDADIWRVQEGGTRVQGENAPHGHQKTWSPEPSGRRKSEEMTPHEYRALMHPRCRTPSPPRSPTPITREELPHACSPPRTPPRGTRRGAYSPRTPPRVPPMIFRGQKGGATCTVCG
eukprot:Sspe_Gene.47574::Locus_24335_Transcript_1_1_Confidence_1.000_Length_1442::g.47574::m.47574